jgi:hypothetical protein
MQSTQYHHPALSYSTPLAPLTDRNRTKSIVLQPGQGVYHIQDLLEEWQVPPVFFQEPHLLLNSQPSTTAATF